jgi:hypothetical protein
MMNNKAKKSDKGLADTGSSAINNSSSFGLGGSFNTTELI